MNKLQIKGQDLVDFLVGLGCNVRSKSDEHCVLWSVFSGDFFVVPIYDEPLSYVALKHIIWQLGISDDAFMTLWDEYINKK